VLRLAGHEACTPRSDLRVGPGDDGAVLPLGDTVTVDALVEGCHFDARLSPADVGYKALAVSVSDLAAMGARPRWAVLALSLPSHDAAWTGEFARGLGEACRRWQVALVGGDTTASPGPRVVSITAGGVLVGAPLRRDGARPGDLLWVTGTLGLAGAGWRLTAPPPAALAALRRPDPPVAFALAVARLGLASAAMDLSDGLAADLPRLLRSSRVHHPTLGAWIGPAALPVGDVPDALDHALRGGEDYQLLLSAPPARSAELQALAGAYGVRLTAIGRCTADATLSLGGGAWPPPAYAHFPSDAAPPIAGLAGVRP
jgi:thiamine-monophosphate kinase